MIASPVATFIFLGLAKSFSPGFEITLSSILVRFAINFLSVGFLLGIIFYEISRKNEYYFYYNLGISKLRLILTSFLFHIIIIIPILIVAIYA
jgi:hypothetical protein